MRKCCQCLGGPPSFKCGCRCHDQEDCRYWETVAFVWIFDSPSDDSRRNAWQRFLMAYPEHAHEDCDGFWGRMLQSRWYDKHKNHFHNPHDYGK